MARPKNKPAIDEATGEEVKFVYPLYTKWLCDVQYLKTGKEGDAKQAKLTLIKKERENVKIEHHEAEAINVQAHNSGRLYVLQDTKTAGDEVTVNVL